MSDPTAVAGLLASGAAESGFLATRATAAAFLAVTSVVLCAVGMWGWHHAADLTPTALSDEGRRKKERALRRGAVACQVIGALMLGLVVMVMTVLK